MNLEIPARDLLRPCVQVFCRQNTTEKIQRKHLHLALVRHLQTVIRLGAIEFAGEGFSHQVLYCISQKAFWKLIVGVIVRIQDVDFPPVH